jgi:hypothetical protein
MSALTPLRGELAIGDRRALYLGWLASAQALGLDADTLEPPVPAGYMLSTAQQMLASFLRLDPDLVWVAAEASPPLEPTGSRQAIESPSTWMAWSGTSTNCGSRSKRSSPPGDRPTTMRRSECSRIYAMRQSETGTSTIPSHGGCGSCGRGTRRRSACSTDSTPRKFA